MCDSIGSLQADLSYSIFPQHNAIVRSTTVKNLGDKEVTIEKLASFSVDLPHDEYELIHLQGEWVRECTKVRRKVEYGMQGLVKSLSHRDLLGRLTTGPDSAALQDIRLTTAIHFCPWLSRQQRRHRVTFGHSLWYTQAHSVLRLRRHLRASRVCSLA